MSDHYLMEKKGAGQMTVPPSKLHAYLADGWVVIREPDPKPEVKQVEELPPPVEVEAVSPDFEPAPVHVDEAVEKIGSKNKRAKRG